MGELRKAFESCTPKRKASPKRETTAHEKAESFFFNKEINHAAHVTPTPLFREQRQLEPA